MRMSSSVLLGAALLACGFSVFAGPLSRRQEINYNLLAPVNLDSTNFLQPSTPDANLFPAGRVVLPDLPINGFGNTLTASTLTGIGSSTGDGTTQVAQEGSTNLGDPVSNPQTIAFGEDPSFPEAEMEQEIGSMRDQTLDPIRYCIYRLLVDPETGNSKLQFFQCGLGGWKKFRDALVNCPTPGYGAFRLEEDKVLSVMNRIHRYQLSNPAGKVVDLPVFYFLHSYKEQWTRVLRSIFSQTVSKDDIVSEQRLDDLGKAVALGPSSPQLTSDPPPQQLFSWP